MQVKFIQDLADRLGTEVDKVGFEVSTDILNETLIGTGIRALGNW